MIDVALTQKITTNYAYGDIAIEECGEGLTGLDGVFAVKPFWLDSDKLNREVEGKYYGSYIEKHRNFQLLVRRSMLERLLIAKSHLPRNWSFVIKAGLRPIEVQRAMFQDFLLDIKQERADWSDEACVAYAGQYVSNPDIGAPPHTTGGAIDIDILDQATGKLVDMGCKVCELGEVSHCLNGALTHEQRVNQENLLSAMCNAGFAPLYSEWWHFSYGDQRWAAFYNKPAAIYDVAKIDYNKA